MVAKLITIFKSRFRKQREEEWVQERRVTCLGCEYNSLNDTSSTITQDFLAALSYFYSWITGRAKDDNLGNCNYCESCSIYFKTSEEEESCFKWKVIDKKHNLNIYKDRKNANNKDNR